MADVFISYSRRDTSFAHELSAALKARGKESWIDVQGIQDALGGSEAYFCRLSRYLAADGAAVTVHTTTALDLEAFWRVTARTVPVGRSCESSPRSSTTDTSARSWTGSSRSMRHSRRSCTSTRGAPRARSSSHWTRAKPRRRGLWISFCVGSHDGQRRPWQ